MAQIHSPDVIGLTIQDPTDITKEASWDVSAITTSTTRTITMPDQNIDLTPGATYASAGATGAAAYLYTDTPAIDPTGTGAGTLVIGDGADGSTFDDAIVIGNGASAGANDVISLGRNSAASGVDSVAIGQNTVSSSFRTIAIGKGATASDTSAIAIGGDFSGSTTASGLDSIAIGRLAVAAGDDSIAIGESADTTGGNSGIAIGNLSTASANDAIAIGESNSASGLDAISLGASATATAEAAIAIGAGADADRFGEVNILPESPMLGGLAPVFATGEIRSGKFVVANITEDATQTELFLDGKNETERISVASDSTIAFSALLVARRQDADNESAAFELKGAIDNNAGTTALVGSPQITTLADDSAGTWAVDVIADDTNDALVFRVTGEAAKTIRWVATVNISEVRG